MKRIRHILAAATIGVALAVGGLGIPLGLESGIAVIGYAAAQTPAGVRAQDDLCFWGQISWEEMSAEEQRLWAVLGWTEANWEGDPSGYPVSEELDWASLTVAEQNAAGAFGFDQRSWDGSVCE